MRNGISSATVRNLKLNLSLLFLVLALSPKAALSLDIIGTDEIKPGMKGYGLTVFQGTEPERFEVEVISVVPNFLLRQDIILVRVKHPVTDNAGVIGGMSGSPIFIEGRLAGAIAYGWSFSKEPVAGVTAIGDMLKVLERKERGIGFGSRLEAAARFPGVKSDKNPAASKANDYFGLFKNPDAGGIVPVRTPLTLGGFASSAARILEEALSEFGLDPVAGGGSGTGGGPRQFVPGGALGVQLIRGDMNATAIGTVSLVKGTSVLAFGHPMFNMGEGYLPVTTARIHTVIASLARSNKLGSPLNEAGSLVQDRNACIAARTDKRAPMIPVTIRLVDERTRRKETYNVEIALHRALTARFVQAALVNVIIDAASDFADVTAEITGDMKVTGRPSIRLYDSGASRAGLANLAGYFRPVGAVDVVMNNPFEEAAVESLDFELRLRYGLEVATITGAYLTAEKPEPGEVINVHVRLKKYDSPEQIITVPVRIPQTAAGKEIQIEVAGGDYITPVMPEPQNLDDILANVARFYPPKSLVVGVNVPGEGVALRGRLIDNLPESAVDALSPTIGYEQISRHRTALREVMPTSFLVQGKETIKVTVGGPVNK